MHLFSVERHRSFTGAQFLDRRVPYWYRDINRQTLDVGDYEKCLMGQLFGTYNIGCEMLNITEKDAFAFGFWSGMCNKSKREKRYRKLAIEWRERIIERLRKDEMQTVVQPETKRTPRRIVAALTTAAIILLCIVSL